MLLSALMLVCLLGGTVGFLANAATPSPATPSLVGTWVAVGAQGEKLTYTFDKQGGVFCMYEQGTIWTGVKARYRVNFKTMPAQIDLYDFSDPDMAQRLLLGIIEFDGAVRFRMTAANGQRPAAFDDMTYEFNKSVT